MMIRDIINRIKIFGFFTIAKLVTAAAHLKERLAAKREGSAFKDAINEPVDYILKEREIV